MARAGFNHIRAGLSAALFAGLITTGCSSPPKEESSPSFRALGRPVELVPTEEARNDEDIGHDVRQQLNLGAPSDSAGIIVEVNDGVITLSGSAPTLAVAWRAAAAAHAVPGVKDVVNNILVNWR